MTDDFTIPHHGLIMIEQRLGVIQPELEHACLDTLFLAAEDTVTPDEITEPARLLADAGGETEPGINDMILAGDIMPKMAEGLFDAATVEGMQPAMHQRMIGRTLHQRIIDMHRHIGRDIQLPPQLTNIGDAVRPRPGIADLNLLHRPEREISAIEALRDQRLEEITRFGTHHHNDAFHGGDIHRHAMRPVRDMAVDPVHIPPDCGGRGDDNKPVTVEAGDRYISLNPAQLIQELGIDNAPRFDRNIIAGNALQHAFGIRAHDHDLAKAGQVKQPDLLPHGLMAAL